MKFKIILGSLLVLPFWAVAAEKISALGKTERPDTPKDLSDIKRPDISEALSDAGRPSISEALSNIERPCTPVEFKWLPFYEDWESVVERYPDVSIKYVADIMTYFANLSKLCKHDHEELCKKLGEKDGILFIKMAKFVIQLRIEQGAVQEVEQEVEQE